MRHGALRSILLFTLPNIVGKAVNLILLPLYASTLSVSGFGLLEPLTTVGLWLNYSLNLGWDSAFTRFYHERDVDHARLIRTTIASRAGAWLIAACVMLLPGPGRWCAWLLDDAGLATSFGLAVTAWIVRDAYSLFEAVYRVQVRGGRFALANCGLCVAHMLLTVWLMLGRGWGVDAVFAGQIGACLAMSGLLLFLERRSIWSHLRGVWLERPLFARMMRYGLPLVPAALAMFLILACDRWMILWHAPTAEAGQEQVGWYALGARFVALASLATAGFQLFFGPYVFRHYRKKNAPARFRRLFSEYSATMFLTASGLCFLSGWTVRAFFPAFEQAIPIIPLLLMGLLIYNIGDYFCVGLAIAERSDVRGWAGAFVAVLNVVLNLALVPFLGPFGAGLATAASYATYSAILLRVSETLYPVGYPLSHWLFPVIWTGGAALVARIDSMWGLPLYAVAGPIVYFATLQRAQVANAWNLARRLVTRREAPAETVSSKPSSRHRRAA